MFHHSGAHFANNYFMGMLLSAQAPCQPQTQNVCTLHTTSQNQAAKKTEKHILDFAELRDVVGFTEYYEAEDKYKT